MKLTKISLSFLFGCMATLPIKAQIVQEAVCENDSIEIGLPAFIQNESIQWMSSNNATNFSDLAGDTLTTLNVAPASPTYFVARITGDNCDPYFSDTVFVNISLAPSVADAGADITDTSNTTTLGANTPTVGTGTWSILPGSGTNGAFSSVNDPNAVFTGDPNETYLLAWTISNPPCPPTVDTVVVNLGVSSGPPLPSISCLNNTLFVHPTDNAGPTPWGCPGSGTAQSTSDIDGQLNTNLIMTNCPNPNTTAAAICANLNAFGFSDWYLPAFDELNCLRNEAATIGGFETGGYWSSTEFAGILGSNAKQRNFPSGVSGASSKSNSHRIRCVRRL
ncbi:MAG: DUF1566 domain-containing protein [Flavobacteriales bacterium]|nr:MAG: DUF1566 domain-containing protein [Flavobacteriales bacterium]